MHNLKVHILGFCVHKGPRMCSFCIQKCKLKRPCNYKGSRHFRLLGRNTAKTRSTVMIISHCRPLGRFSQFHLFWGFCRSMEEVFWAEFSGQNSSKSTQRSAVWNNHYCRPVFRAGNGKIDTKAWVAIHASIFVKNRSETTQRSCVLKVLYCKGVFTALTCQVFWRFWYFFLAILKLTFQKLFRRRF